MATERPDLAELRRIVNDPDLYVEGVGILGFRDLPVVLAALPWLLDEVERLTTELADVRAAAIEYGKVIGAPDPALRARGIRLGASALLAGAGDAEGGEHGD